MQESKQYIETEFMTLWLEDGIVNVIFKGAMISLEMAKQVVEHRLLLSQKKFIHYASTLKQENFRWRRRNIPGI